MNKTPIGTEFIKILNSINDQLMFYLFSEEELKRKLRDFSDDVEDHFTTHVFAKNKYSLKIHVRLNELPKFLKDNRKLTFGSYFSTSYEVVKGYLIRSLVLLKDINSSTFIKTTRDTPEMTFIETLRFSHCNLPDQELIGTLAYLRLRRNHFTHHNKTLAPIFKDLIENNGELLNAFWGSSDTCIHLDFSKKDITNFSENETIELINCLRIITKEIDSCLASSLSMNGCLDYIAQEVFSNKPVRMNIFIEEKRTKKLQYFANQYFGLNCTVAQASLVVNRIGVR
ncbi:hypothetical protein KJA15_03525 [Patescibacteria group bacterium]|nr:hypothetical protein [Patescibacteria group bacterium]